MAHRSETNCSLSRKHVKVGCASDLAVLEARQPAVWTFLLPFAPSVTGCRVSGEWVSALRAFLGRMNGQSTVCILTTPEGAATLWPQLEDLLRFHLWVGVKIRRPEVTAGGLPLHHAALLVMTKYRESLRHTKTRIGYTYCPACDRTTKDYGGKKHTYDPYGTLMSDVWRDIDCDPAQFPVSVVGRLQDLFGLPPYESLNLVDLRALRVLKREHEASPPNPPGQFQELPQGLRSELIKGECLEVLHQVPSDSVDFCFADPPYNLKKKYDNWNDGIDVREYFEWCDRWLAELARVLKPGRTLAVLNIPLWAIRHFTFMAKILEFQNWIVWEGLSLPVRMVMPAHYSIVCFSKGPPRIPPGLIPADRCRLERESLTALKELYCLRQDCVRARRLLDQRDSEALTDLWWDIHRLKHNSRRVDHPCQLPPALMRRLIALFTKEGECVLDPFNGAGTTTLAAEQLNRDFIGIELSPKYHELASKRHAELRSGLDPFEKTSRVPKAKNSNVKRLPKQHYAVPKKDLQLDVRRIARELGRLPSREDVVRLGKYSIEYYDKYFISWGEVCAAARNAGMNERRTLILRDATPPRQMVLDLDAGPSGIRGTPH